MFFMRELSESDYKKITSVDRRDMPDLMSRSSTLYGLDKKRFNQLSNMLMINHFSIIDISKKIDEKEQMAQLTRHKIDEDVVDEMAAITALYESNEAINKELHTVINHPNVIAGLEKERIERVKIYCAEIEVKISELDNQISEKKVLKKTIRNQESEKISIEADMASRKAQRDELIKQTKGLKGLLGVFSGNKLKEIQDNIKVQEGALIENLSKLPKLSSQIESLKIRYDKMPALTELENMRDDCIAKKRRLEKTLPKENIGANIDYSAITQKPQQSAVSQQQPDESETNAPRPR